MPPKASSSKMKDEGKDQDSARYVAYHELRDSDKYVFNLNSNVLELRQQFTHVISFLRMKSSADGCVIRGIPEARCVTGCPLLEIKVTYKDIGTRFLIAKASLYIVGYSYDGEWYCFSDAEIKLVGHQKLAEVSNYEKFFCKELGAKVMLKALRDMQESKSSVRRSGCAVYCIHLSEAARFRPIEYQVYLGICPSNYTDFDELLDWQRTPFPWFVASKNLREEFDIMNLISPPFSTDFNVASASFVYGGDLVRSWSKLSQGWAMYCATESMQFIEPSLDIIFKECRIRDLHSLNSTLGLLCGLDFKAISEKVEEKLGTGRDTLERRMAIKNTINKWEEDRKKEPAKIETRAKGRR